VILRFVSNIQKLMKENHVLMRRLCLFFAA